MTQRLPRPWPWDDRGRSAIACDIATIERESREAVQAYWRAMRSRNANRTA